MLSTLNPINNGTGKMLTKQVIIYILLLVVVVFCVNCEDHFLGYGPQPCYFEKTEFEPLLNVLGVLRPGDADSMSLSFVCLEQTLSTTSIDDEDSLDVSDADVTVYAYDAFGNADSLKLMYTDPDSIFSTYTYRSDNLFPDAGKVYGLSCRREGYPELTAETLVPHVPQILDGSIHVSENVFSFDIERDELAVVYDVSLCIGHRKFDQRLRRPESDNIPVSFQIPTDSENTATIFIIAYDLNLSEYLAYNVGIKPNTYRVDYSTVENGYGCFGSLNVLSVDVDF